MARRLRARVAKSGRAAEVVEAPAEAIPFNDATFDTVVATLVLCSVRDPAAALRAVARVLKPGGQLIFIEHVRAESPRLGRWQDRLQPLQSFLFGGCHPNRPTAQMLAQSPLEIAQLRRTTMPSVAGPLVRPLIIGVARR
jgi:ubiquinone/menaquinone biosynthesis C-methylase UbiE